MFIYRIQVKIPVECKYCKTLECGCPKSWRLSMQNYFGPFYFGELKPYNSKYCSNVVLFWPAVDIRAL